MIFRTRIFYLVLLPALGLSACQTLIADYSLEAYKNDTTLKADVANLVEESNTPHDGHIAEINALTLKLREAYEFSKGESYNKASTAEWEVLLDPNGPLYYRFLSRWNSAGALNAAQIGTWKTLLDRAFDLMICLETNKQSSAACPAPEAIAATPS